AVEMVDHLDRLDVDQRPGDLAISVRPREVVLSLEDEEKWVTMPDDRFYLSVVPYVEQPQDCVHHSMTTSQGELVTESVRVKVKDRTNDVVLLDEAVTTFEN